MITRLVVFDEGQTSESRETRDFASIAALTEWLARVRGAGFRVRVVC